MLIQLVMQSVFRIFPTNPPGLIKLRLASLKNQSYPTPKVKKNNIVNEAIAKESMLKPHNISANNMYYPQGIEPSIILYSVNQSVDLQLWNSNFCLISIFNINESLEDNTKNIACSLYRMAFFIRQRKLENKTAKDIPQIVEFGFTAWDILSIYKSE